MNEMTARMVECELGNVTAEFTKVNKNGAMLDAIKILPDGKNVGVLFYEGSAEEICEQFRSMKMPEFELPEWDDIKYRIRMKMIPKDIEYLKDKVWTYWNDLAVVYMFPIDDDYDKWIAINKGMYDDLDVINRGINNLYLEKPVIKGMSEVLFGFADENECQYIVTNESGKWGAANIIETNIEHLADRMKTDKVYLIPSSINEWIVANANCIPINEVNKMIVDINNSEVEPSERLGNHAYVWSRDTGVITW